MTPEERHRLYLDVLFSKYADREPADDLASIGEYFEYVASQIDYEHISVNAPTDLISRFEATCLLLRDRLRLYPESVQVQVTEILKDGHLERTFAVFAALSSEDRKRLQRQSFFAQALEGRRSEYSEFGSECS